MQNEQGGVKNGFTALVFCCRSYGSCRGLCIPRLGELGCSFEVDASFFLTMAPGPAEGAYRPKPPRGTG
jgi:hypothetical protein